MKVLVIGSGGREHALAWKLAQSPFVQQVFTAPGNPGTALAGTNVPIAPDDFEELIRFTRKERVDLTVVGPEAPLVAGIVDRFRSEGLSIFGPTQAAAQLEGSKQFAKEFMQEFGIPTASFASFEALAPALEYVRRQGAPIVIKADGLAAGKGVTVAMDLTTAQAALRQCFEEKAFGAAGHRVVIEDYLEGEEVSVLAICDGKSFVTLPPSQDHKRLLDGDAGPNTGGMGAYSPAPILDAELQRLVEACVLRPTLDGMIKRGTPYAGVLYAGLVLTKEGIKVLEFNCRMGDPETQAVLPVVESDLFDLFSKAASGGLADCGPVRTGSRSAVCVVMASAGYPGTSPKGRTISGLDSVNPDTEVFHAGTAFGPNGEVVTSGGRVLGVTALGEDISEAITNAYASVCGIHFDGAQYRRDIGRKAIALLNR
jgi:phosphoribosylamine--glycine ligase